MNNFWNVPNFLSLFRLVLVPVFLIAFFFEPSGNYIAALVIFLIASLTDIVDGIIARSTGQITKEGEVLDPLADKMLKMAALISFGVVGVIPVWLVVTLITVDLCMIIAGVFLFKRKVTVPSNIWGKSGTVIMSCGIILCFFNEWLNGWNLYVLYLGFACVVFSVIIYIISNFNRFLGVLKKKQ